MLIRTADPVRDAADCAAIYAPFVAGTAVSFEEDPPSAEAFAGRIATYSRTHPYLVAEADGRAVGFAYSSPHRERIGYRWAADVSVYLAEDARGRGVGRALYAELLARLTAQGFWWACAGITLPNPASVRLHESLGFELVGTFRRIGWKAGAWRDVACFQRPLRPIEDPAQGPPPDPGPPAA